MKRSLAEALTNAAIGLLVSWAITYAVLPLWGLYPSPMASAQITAVYFIISTARAFVIREAFRKWAS